MIGEEGSVFAPAQTWFAQIYLIQRPVEGAPYSFNTLTCTTPEHT